MTLSQSSSADSSANSGFRRGLFSRRSQRPVVNKLETFLKRTLPFGDYPKVRTYEACIIRGEDGNPVSKYAIVTNDGLFITDNPHPKVLNLAVDLRTVVSIGLVNDYPDFLQGKDRENIQHVCITYINKNNKDSTSKQSSPSKSQKSLRSRLNSDASTIPSQRNDSSDTVDSHGVTYFSTSASSSREDLSIMAPGNNQGPMAMGMKSSSSVPSLLSATLTAESLDSLVSVAVGSIIRESYRSEVANATVLSANEASINIESSRGLTREKSRRDKSRRRKKVADVRSEGKQGDGVSISVHSHCDSGFLDEEAMTMSTATIPTITTSSPVKENRSKPSVREGHEYDSLEDRQSLSSDGSSSTCSGSISAGSQQTSKQLPPTGRVISGSYTRGSQPQVHTTAQNIPEGQLTGDSTTTSSQCGTGKSMKLLGFALGENCEGQGSFQRGGSSLSFYGMRPSYSHQHLISAADDYRSLSPDISLSTVDGAIIGTGSAKRGLADNRALLMRTLSMPRCVSAMSAQQRKSTSAMLTSVPRYQWRSGSIESLQYKHSFRHSFLNVVDVTMRNDVIREEEPKNLSKFHIYVLNEESNFPQWIKIAWTMHVIEATLALDPTSAPSKRRSSIQSKEKLEMLLHDLKEELMDLDSPEEIPLNGDDQNEITQPSGSLIVQRYSLIQELHVAAKKSVELRHLFWKDHEFCFYLLNIAETCSVTEKPGFTSLHLRSQEREKSLVEAQEELELLNLTLETLATLLQGSTNKTQNAEVLQTEVSLGKPTWLKLLDIILSKPELPTGSRLEGSSPTFDSSSDDSCTDEFSKTLGDLMDSKVAVLYEILKTLSLHFVQPLSSVLNSSAVQLQRRDSNEWMERFVNRLVCLMWPEDSSRRLTPKEAILVYKYLFVLHHLLLCSVQLREHMKQSCRSDFELATHEGWLEVKLSSNYPLVPLIQEELRAVKRIGTQ